MMYLPDKRELVKLPKQYLVNVCFKVIGPNFEIWMRQIIDERNQKIKEKQNLMISMDSEIAKVFNCSNFVSRK